MRRLLPSLLLAAVAIASTACTSSIATPSNYAPFSQTDLVVGTGAAAVKGQSLTVAYTGWVYDEAGTDRKGPTFDASGADAPFTFVLGNGEVIPGWEQGLVGMQAGGKRRLIIPPMLAYGAFRRGTIPPNATIVFDVELLSLQ
jgi:FKBP-type peptidyl-prolyl cis-trans isomerase FkpA